MNVHDLDGCAPIPLAHYLKALGILRLVAEQADPAVRGWWDGDRFKLASTLTRGELLEFFRESYEPTPIFNPWGGRSGFYSGSSEKSAREVLTAIERSTDRRLTDYRMTIRVVREVIRDATGGSKPNDDQKDKFVLALRKRTRGKSSAWIDAVVAIVGAGSSFKLEQPALFGTGGNEGSGSYTSAYMAAIDQCILRRRWDHALEMALFGRPIVPRSSWDQSMGQFLPEATLTPWDFLLAFEGGCVVRSAISSRNVSTCERWMSSPFYMAPNAYGYPSGARLDEYALKNGKELPGRGEQWFPLWSRPVSFEELSYVFVQGRAVTRRGRAVDGLSMARAVASLGVARGMRAFIRYGYQQRNNLATHFAVPLGRFQVPEHVTPHSAALDDLDAWLQRLRRRARASNAPNRLRLAERRLSDAVFSVLQHCNEPSRWQSVLLALANVEAVQATGAGYQAGVIPKLRPEWVEAADEGSPEFRLAMAFALQARAFDRKSGRPIDPIRRHSVPLDADKPWRFATSGTGGETRLHRGPDVVMHGRRGVDDAVALVERRLIEAAQRGERRLPLQAAPRSAAWPADLAALIAGAVDLDRTLAFGRALMALDRGLWVQQYIPLSEPGHHEFPDDAWLIIRLAMLPWPLPDGRKVGVDPAIVRRLDSGDGAAAVNLALRRLNAAGIYPAVRVASVPADVARRWVAALAFPISQETAQAFVRRLDPHSLKETA